MSKLEKAKNLATTNVNIFGRSIPVALVAMLLTGGATAAVATIVAPTISGSGTVINGYQFNLESVSGAATDEQPANDNSFTADMAQGSQFGFSLSKENLANEKTEPLAEVTVISSSSMDLNHKTLEQVDFDAVQTTNKSDGSTVPAGRPVNATINISSDGSVSNNSAAEAYMRLATANVNDDQYDEILVCVGDSAGNETKLDEKTDGMQFGPNEHWNADYTIDTQSSFQETAVSVNTTMRTIWNPTTGDVSDVVASCPQYDGN